MIKRNEGLIFNINIYYNIIAISLLWQSIFCFKSIYAENITEVSGLVVDGSTNTVIDRAVNNVPIINIASPNANGVSLNNFSDYNVTNENQIINNYKGLATDTKLSGQIYGNPNFNQSGINEAKIIINQVTGNNRSNINGITEIAGRNADIIIANGNGIDIKGASYINTARLSFITGIVNIDKKGGIDYFTLSSKENADITIDGLNNDNYNNLGLDASKVDYVDIITRSAKIAGDIYVDKELNFGLGNDNYDYNNNIISSNANSGMASKPFFALDSSDLGGMYVGKIILTANENGVGVRVRGDISTNIDDIIFNVDGNIDYERLNSARNINLNSKNGKITQGLYHNSLRQAITNSKGDIILSANNGIDIADLANLYAAQSIYLNSANNIVKNSGKIRSDALMQNNGGIFINANFFENNFNIFSSNNLGITADNIVNNSYGNIESLKSMTINAGKFINSSIIRSGLDINIKSSDDFFDNGQIKAVGNLSIIANNGINYHNIYSGGDLSIINNNGDIRQSLQSYSLGRIDIANNGGNIYFGSSDGKSENGNLYSIYAKSNINIVTKGNIINNSKIYSEDNIMITAQNLVNGASIISFNNKIPNNSSLANLTVNLDNDFTNYGLILSSHNINLNIDGNITNDANSGSAEIFALKGDINISGKIYNTDFGNINKYDLFYLSFDKSSEIWDDLIANKYIDYNGNITDIFKDLGDSSSMIIKPSLAIYKQAIFDLINNLSVKIVKNGRGDNSLELIARNFDSSATDIYNYLLESKYIDSNGKILQKFYIDTSNIGGDGIILGSNNDISFLKNDIYQLLQDARNGKIIENIFLDIDEISNKDLSSTLINQLRNKGYIDENGNVTKIFNDIKNADELDLTAEFSYYKQDIYNKINSTRLINKVLVSNFDNINYIANSTINNANQLYIQLQKEGFIDDNGNITDKFYINPIFSKESPLIDYQNIVTNILSNINQATISDISFRKINKSLDNSASRLFSHLIAAGYLNSDGTKGDNFNFVNESDFANNFSFVANGGEYEKVRTSIWNKLIKENNDYIFQISDFLGQDFDSNILYDERQILMNDLIKNGYLSSNGDIKQSFYNLSDNYNNFNLDYNFLVFRNEIIDLLSTASKTQSMITNQNFSNIAQNSTKENAEQIFNQMLASSYIDSRGNFTQKLVDEVINYQGTDTEKSSQLKLGSLQNYASGVYQQIKANNGIKSVKNYNNKIENLNGASITSSFGDINIKSLTVNNIAKDNKNIILDPESAVNRTLHRSINWAWKGTVLWGYDTIFSNLDSNQSQIKAGNNINITADNIFNNSSNILAGNNIEIKVGTLSNSRTQFTSSIPYIYETHWKKCKKFGGCDSGRYYNTYQNRFKTSLKDIF
jgi:filamentous hemagglutinin family protein